MYALAASLAMVNERETLRDHLGTYEAYVCADASTLKGGKCCDHAEAQVAGMAMTRGAVKQGRSDELRTPYHVT